MSACLWGTCWLHWLPGRTCLAEWSKTVNKSRADHTILCLFSSSLPLHPRTHHVSQLSPAARTVTSHQMFVITNSVRDTTSRAELMKDMWAFFMHFMQNSLGCLKLSWKAIDFALKQMRKLDSWFGCGSSDTPMQHNLSAASFLPWH